MRTTCAPRPFGDHTGFYTPQDLYPTFHITHVDAPRRGLLHHGGGPPPMEDLYLGKATERIFLPIITTMLPTWWTTTSPPRASSTTGPRLGAQTLPGHAKKLMSAIWGLGMLSLTRCIVVVDHDIDVQTCRRSRSTRSRTSIRTRCAHRRGARRRPGSRRPVLRLRLEDRIRCHPQVGGRGVVRPGRTSR